MDNIAHRCRIVRGFVFVNDICKPKKQNMLLAVMVCILFSAAKCQQPMAQAIPDQGQFRGGTYTNAFFGIRYTLPKGEAWFVNAEMLQEDASTPNRLTGQVHLTILDRHTGGPIVERVVLMAVDENLYHFNSPGDYVEKMTSALAKRGQTVTGPAVSVQFGGRQFYREDFSEDRPSIKLYKALVATEARSFLISWTFVASSKERLEQLVGTLSELSFAPMPSSSPPPDTPSTPPKRIRISYMVLDKYIIERPAPAYPEEAKRARIEGPVRLHVILSKTGELISAQVMTGDPMLRQAALGAIRHWKFKPYILNGEPVEVESQITINFKL